MDDHNWSNKYKDFSGMLYRKCYNCGVIETRAEYGVWGVSIKSEFFDLYKFKETPSCNYLQMQRALG